MRYGILGDIHSNIEALSAAYKKLSAMGCDKMISLGDMVGYGPSPGECIDFCRDYRIECIKGNHDTYVADLAHSKSWDLRDYARLALLWTQEILLPDQIQWLDRLPYTLRDDNALFIHASIETLDGEYWPYVLDRKAAQFHFYLQDMPVAFCGHIHIPLLFTCNSGEITMEMLKKEKLNLSAGRKYLINPGSVGQPRDSDWRAAVAIYDSETGIVEPVRVEYDLKKTQLKILAAGLPSVLAERLSRGC
ncbi:MAG: metallophosphoesterase family protein [Victivallaceae bacterium]